MPGNNLFFTSHIVFPVGLGLRLGVFVAPPTALLAFFPKTTLALKFTLPACSGDPLSGAALPLPILLT